MILLVKLLKHKDISCINDTCHGYSIIFLWMNNMHTTNRYLQAFAHDFSQYVGLFFYN